MVSGSPIKEKRYFHVFKMVTMEWLSAIGISVGHYSVRHWREDGEESGEGRSVMKLFLKKCALHELIVVR